MQFIMSPGSTIVRYRCQLTFFILGPFLSTPTYKMDLDVKLPLCYNMQLCSQKSSGEILPLRLLLLLVVVVAASAAAVVVVLVVVVVVVFCYIITPSVA